MAKPQDSLHPYLQFCCAIKFAACGLSSSSFQLQPKACLRQVVEFRTSSILATGKHAFGQSSQRLKGQLKGQTKRRTIPVQSLLFFSLPFCINSNLTAMAARRNRLSSLLELESVTIQDTIFLIRGEVRIK